MKINAVENAVLKQHLNNIGYSFELSDTDFDTLEVDERTLTGNGFITDLAKGNRLKIGDFQKSSPGGEVGAILNSTIDTGYLFYVEDGYLKSIEGYTFDEAWPDKIWEVDVYKQELR